MPKSSTAAPAPPTATLVVVHPFGPYDRGAHISDPKEIKTILAGENAHHCNPIAPQ